MLPRSLAALGLSALILSGAAGCGGSGGLNAGVPRGVDFAASYRPAVASRLPRSPKEGAGKPRASRRVVATRSFPR
jgi:hypothetical protein